MKRTRQKVHKPSSKSKLSNYPCFQIGSLYLTSTTKLEMPGLSLSTASLSLPRLMSFMARYKPNQRKLSLYLDHVTMSRDLAGGIFVSLSAMMKNTHSSTSRFRGTITEDRGTSASFKNKTAENLQLSAFLAK